MSERQKLTILEVKEPQAVGDKGAQMVKFRAKDKDGVILWYTTFTKSLFGVIKLGAEVEVDPNDVEVKTREHNGTEYTDRRVSQLYINGKPMAMREARQFAGPNRRSPEEIASIEMQVFAKLAMEGWIAGKLADDSKSVKGLISLMEARLCAAPKAASEVKAATKAKLKTKEVAPPEDPEVAFPSVSKETEERKALKERTGQFEIQCKRLGWSFQTHSAQIAQWLQTHFGARWIELTPEAQEKAIAGMKAEADEMGAK